MHVKLLILLGLLLAACSKPEKPQDLPAYSDMGAAADAGRTQFDKP